MKFLSLISILVFSLIVVIGCDREDYLNETANVDIPDSALRAAIEKQLSIESGSPITAEDMLKITKLDLSGEGVSNLTDLEYATNLEELNLRGNAITDLSPLTGLKNLVWLELGANAIIDISPLAGLTNLEWLSLFKNAIIDISPLAGLTNLEWLALSDNAIADVSPLTGLTNLEEVYLDGNPLSSASKTQFIPTIEANGTFVYLGPIILFTRGR